MVRVAFAEPHAGPASSIAQTKSLCARMGRHGGPQGLQIGRARLRLGCTLLALITVTHQNLLVVPPPAGTHNCHYPAPNMHCTMATAATNDSSVCAIASAQQHAPAFAAAHSSFTATNCLPVMCGDCGVNVQALSPSIADIFDDFGYDSYQGYQCHSVAAYVLTGNGITEVPRDDVKDAYCTAMVLAALPPALQQKVQCVAFEEVSIDGRVGENAAQLSEKFKFARILLNVGEQIDTFLTMLGMEMGAVSVTKAFDFKWEQKQRLGSLVFCDIDRLDETERFVEKQWSLGEASGWACYHAFISADVRLQYRSLPAELRAKVDKKNQELFVYSVRKADPEKNKDVEVNTFRMLYDKDGRPTQWFIIFTSPDNLGNLPFVTYVFTGRQRVDKMPDGSEQRGPELKTKKVAYNSIGPRHRCVPTGGAVAVVVAGVYGGPGMQVLRGLHARRGRGAGPSAAPTERDGWIGPGRRPVPGEEIQQGIAMASAAHQRMGQMRDGKRARPE